MKIAYLCYLPLADVDFSYLEEAMKINDMTCYIFINQHHINKSVISLNKLYGETGIFSCNIYPELLKYSSIINLDKIRIVNLAHGKLWRLRGLFLFNKLLKELDAYDIVHIPFIPQGFDFPLYKIRNKCLLSVHDPLPHSGTSRIWEFFRKTAFNLFDRFVLFNNNQKDEFCRKYKIDPDNLIVSSLSCYTCLRLVSDNFSVSSLPKFQKYILFFGGINIYKGLQFLLPAFKEIHKKYPELNLVVAGGGKFPFDKSEYDKLEYIEFRNRFIPDNELIPLIKGSLFVVCPYTDATQSGVVMTAFTFNKPVLATNVGGLPEMIENERHGLIVKERDVNALIEGLRKMIEDEEKLNNYSENIKNDFRNGERSWMKIAKEIKEFYTKISEQKKY